MKIFRNLLWVFQGIETFHHYLYIIIYNMHNKAICYEIKSNFCHTIYNIVFYKVYLYTYI